MSIIEKAIQSAAGQATARKDMPAEALAPRQPEPAVSFDLLRSKGMLTTRDASPRAMEQIRRIKRPVLTNAFGPLAAENGNLVMITSPNPGAGKTFIAMHLARSLTVDRDYHVLLVDADNAKATLTRGLELDETRGLFDLLDETSKTPLDELALGTELPGLAVIPSGRHYHDSEELLAGRRAGAAFRELAQRDAARVVILDCPPLLASPDALAIAGLAGQIVLVVGAGVTDEAGLNRALELLSGLEKPVGIIFNQAPLSSWMPDFRGYGYGYGDPR